MIIPVAERQALIAQALDLAGVPKTVANADAVNIIVTHESGWDPAATNNWDSNAKAGHPSKGLMQCIQSTFDAHSIAGHENILAPLDNLIAGIRYAIGRYGSLSNVPGVKRVLRGRPYVGY